MKFKSLLLSVAILAGSGIAMTSVGCTPTSEPSHDGAGHDQDGEGHDHDGEGHDHDGAGAEHADDAESQ